MAINNRQQKAIDTLQSIISEWEEADDLLGEDFYNSMELKINTLVTDIDLKSNLGFLLFSKMQEIFRIIKNLEDVN